MTIFQTERLLLRTLDSCDRASLCETLQDGAAMYAYEHAFSDEEVDEWLARQTERYARDGFGLWAVIRREDGAFLGQCGLTMQSIGTRRVPEIGYLLARRYWHNGYATEAALGCREYAFHGLGLQEVYCIIRENNLASRRVAVRLDMQPVGSVIKHYYGMQMPHIVYCVRADK